MSDDKANTNSTTETPSDKSNASPAVPVVPHYTGTGVFYVPVPSNGVNYPYLQPTQPQQVPQPQMPQMPQMPQVGSIHAIATNTIQRVYFQQTNQYVPLQETTATPSADPAYERKSWSFGCRGWGHPNGDAPSCMKLSNRPLGTFYEFVSSLLFSTFVPILGPLLIFGMESSQLARIGAFYGIANVLLVIAISVLHAAMWVHHAAVWVIGGISLIAAFAVYVKTHKRLKGYFYLYQQAVATSKDKAMPVVSEIGQKGQYAVAFCVSLLFTFIGAAIAMCCKRTLHCRYGALNGLAWTFIWFGTLFAPPVLAVGLLLHQVLHLHFTTAFVSAEAAANSTAAINV